MLRLAWYYGTIGFAATATTLTHLVHAHTSQPDLCNPGSNGVQDFGTNTLTPGAWDFYALTLPDSFQRKQSSLAIEWLVTDPKEGNYSNALMAFNQGAYPRCVWWCLCVMNGGIWC